MRNRRGFSMIELVIVMVIVAILSGIAYVAIGFFGDAKLNTVADKVAMDIKYARDLSVSTTRQHGVQFNVNPTNTYNVFIEAATGEANIDDPANMGSVFVVDLYSKYGTTISSVNIGGGSKVVFDAYGTPSDDGGGTELVAEGSVVLAAGSNTVTIYITPETGRVRIE